MLDHFTVYNSGQTLKQHWVNVSCSYHAVTCSDRLASRRIHVSVMFLCDRTEPLFSMFTMGGDCSADIQSRALSPCQLMTTSQCVTSVSVSVCVSKNPVPNKLWPSHVKHQSHIYRYMFDRFIKNKNTSYTWLLIGWHNSTCQCPRFYFH